MERVALPQEKLTPTFIGSWMMEPISICDDLITYFETNQNKQKKGTVAGGADVNKKNSIDITILPKEIELPENEVLRKYINNLFSCYTDYVTQWPFLKGFATNVNIPAFNLQRYQQGQHFQGLHTERAGLSTLHRVFAWMTYLNDVELEDGGSTFFSHYDLDVQPQKGLTLIWPAEWTHAHKGTLMKKNSKYIITGWMHFPE